MCGTDTPTDPPLLKMETNMPETGVRSPPMKKLVSRTQMRRTPLLERWSPRKREWVAQGPRTPTQKKVEFE